MENILDMLNSDLGKQVIAGISKKTNTSSKETASVLSSAIPAILGGLQNNTSTQSGANGILSALTSHDGGVLDNLAGFFGDSNRAAADGKGILGHALGSQESSIKKSISKKTGVDAGKVAQIIAIAAPIVMGYLGKQTQTNGVSDSKGLSSLLGGLLGGNSGGSVLNAILDQNGDGKLDLSDLAGLASGQKQGGGFLGGLFGKLFGK
ncbi:MAG: DUF937 domain-containing protein [Flavobacteriaceae bacterium]|nr:DUF937 domain-containing protein [Flavobacteriaceae bacterium]